MRSARFFAVWACARLASSPSARQTEEEARRATRHVLHAGVALGLCAAVNPMIALCTGIAVAPGILLRIGRRKLPPQALLYALCGGALGLAPYVYLLLIRARTDVIIWGAPRDAASLWQYVSLHDYAANQTIDRATWLQHGFAWLWWAAQHWLALLLVLGFAGRVNGRSRSRSVPRPIRSSPSFWSRRDFVQRQLEARHSRLRRVCGRGLVARGGRCRCVCGLRVGAGTAVGRVRAGGLPGGVLVRRDTRVPLRTRHRNHTARRIAERVLRRSARARSSDRRSRSLRGIAFYLQEAEHRRPDVIVLAYGLASSTWHWEHLQHMHPDLVPISLRGAGGKVGRVQRLLRANPARAVLVERFEIAQLLGLRACAGGLYLRTGSACDSATTASPSQRASSQVRSRTWGTARPMPQVRSRAYRTRSGNPCGAWASRISLQRVAGRRSQSDATQPAAVRARPRTRPPLTGSLPSWQRAAALGDPARNLFVAGAIVAA